MSLLMEALRKAEEAKSKTANKDDKDSADNDDALSLSAESFSTDTPPDEASDKSRDLDLEQATPEHKPLMAFDNEAHEAQEQGPVVINPDPDEEETLASHYAEAEQDKIDSEEFASHNLQAKVELKDPEIELEKIDFHSASKTDEDTIDEPGQPSSESTFDDDEGLSLLQSSYFTRTKKPGGPNFADLEQDDHEHETPPTTVESVTETTSSQQDKTDLAFDAEPLVDEPAEESPDNEELAYMAPDLPVETVQDNAATVTDAGNAGNAGNRERAKEQEKENRNSVGSLFLAKEASKKQSQKKYRSIAAVLLVIPVAGIAYWFYSSLNSSSQIQFSLPANSGLENRGFIDAGANIAGNTDNINNIENIESTLATEVISSDQVQEEILASAELPVSLATDPQASLTTQVQDTTQIAQEIAAVSPTSQVDDSPDSSITQITPPSAQNVIALESPAQNQINAPGLNFVRSEVTVTINPDLNAAYDSYQNGDLVAAGRLYQQVLNSEPGNRDAALGLASVYLNQGNISFSQNLYARLLELNPRDPLALAGLLDVSMRDDPVRQESELKSLINAYPGVAPLAFALGNLYASQNRWSEAQNAYFDALLSAKSANNGSVSPDYAFNLAVSLERVNQLPAALDYYREAEEFSRFAAPGFNPALLNQRLNYLEQRVP